MSFSLVGRRLSSRLEAIIGHIVEPDILGLRPLGEQQHSGRDASVGSEDSGRHRHHPIQAVFFDQALAQFEVRPAGAKQHTIRDDHRTAPAHVQRPQDQVDEKQLRAFRVVRVMCR